MAVDWIKELDEMLEEGGTAVMDPPPQWEIDSPWRRLVEAIEQAVVVDDLGSIMDDTDAEFACDRLTQAQAEALAWKAMERARQLDPITAHTKRSDVAASNKTRKLRSKALGEDILLAGNQALIPPDNTLVVYRFEEVEQLLGMPPDQLKQVHLIKTMFDGEVVQDE